MHYRRQRAGRLLAHLSAMAATGAIMGVRVENSSYCNRSGSAAVAPAGGFFTDARDAQTRDKAQDCSPRGRRKAHCCIIAAEVARMSSKVLVRTASPSGAQLGASFASLSELPPRKGWAERVGLRLHSLENSPHSFSATPRRREDAEVADAALVNLE